MAVVQRAQPRPGGLRAVPHLLPARDRQRIHPRDTQSAAVPVPRGPGELPRAAVCRGASAVGVPQVPALLVRGARGRPARPHLRLRSPCERRGVCPASAAGAARAVPVAAGGLPPAAVALLQRGAAVEGPEPLAHPARGPLRLLPGAHRGPLRGPGRPLPGAVLPVGAAIAGRGSGRAGTALLAAPARAAAARLPAGVAAELAALCGGREGGAAAGPGGSGGRDAALPGHTHPAALQPQPGARPGAASAGPAALLPLGGVSVPAGAAGPGRLGSKGAGSDWVGVLVRPGPHPSSGPSGPAEGLLLGEPGPDPRLPAPGAAAGPAGPTPASVGGGPHLHLPLPRPGPAGPGAGAAGRQ
mmetsp:Transcript_5715/g.8553  ORF Transcript_5715/g.8553 Transcript_5715/m.8553 type:complete len:357 (-) Transcript_5715:412-1482(-)